MSSSLTEMVIAIAVLGIVMTGLIVTTAKTMVTYQAADVQVRESTGHSMAALCADKILGRTWRDADPPDGYGDLTTATASEIRVDAWRVRVDSGVLEQTQASGPFEPLADSVTGFQFAYRFDGGTWDSRTLDADDRSGVIAIRSNWTDAATGRAFGEITVLPDRQFSFARLALPTPDTAGAYDRIDHERQVAFSLGTWP